MWCSLQHQEERNDVFSFYRKNIYWLPLSDGWPSCRPAGRHTGHWRMVNTDIADSRRGPASNRVRSIQNNPGNTIKYICLKWISSESVFNSEIWESLWWFIAHREQGGGHESRHTAFEYWSVVQKRAQLECKLWVSVYDECGVVEMVRWCGEGGHYPLLDSWAPVRHRQTPFGSCWARVGCGAAEGSTSSDTLIQPQHSALWRVSLFQRSRPQWCFVIVFETGSRPHPISEITGTRRRRWQRGADGKLIPGWGNSTTTSTGTQTSPAATQSSTQVMLSTDWYLHQQCYLLIDSFN